MKIRIAEEKDIKEILKIYTCFFARMAELQPMFWQEAEQDEVFLKNIINNNTSDILTAEDEYGIIGFALVQEQETLPFACIIPRRYAYLMDLAVSPDFQRKGVGTRLMMEVKEWAKQRSLDYIELNVLEENKEARKLYELLEFKATSCTMKYIM